MMEDRFTQREKRWQQRAAEAGFHGPYWWVTGVVQGKRFLYGPEPTKESASNLGLRESGVAFECFSTPTKDKSEARQRIAAIIAQEKHNLPEMLQRFKRKPGQPQRPVQR